MSIQIPKWMTEYNPGNPSVAQSIHMSNTKPSEALQHNEDLEKQTGCPNPDCHVESSLWSIIIHVNDEHKWSREDIADWLDSLPNQPTFYPDVRTDDEKIADAEKCKLISAQGVDNPIASCTITSKLPSFPIQSGPIQYKENYVLSGIHKYTVTMLDGHGNPVSTNIHGTNHYYV